MNIAACAGAAKASRKSRSQDTAFFMGPLWFSGVREFPALLTLRAGVAAQVFGLDVDLQQAGVANGVVFVAQGPANCPPLVV